MKRTIIFSFAALIIGINSQAQFKNIFKKDSSGRNGFQKIIRKTTSTQGLSNDEIVSGLKEALSVGTSNASQKLSAADGFFKNAAIKILMPEQAKKVEKSCVFLEWEN